MAFATKQRMKVLPSVTVHGLEAALEKGFSQVGHRCLTPFIPLLSKMTWKTAASSHLDAFVALEAILFFLLLECANGLIPDMLLAKAFESLHKKPNAGFSYSGPLNFEAISVFFLLKLRQLAGKIRSLVAEKSVWEQTARKADACGYACLLRLCRVLQPNFMADAATSIREPGAASRCVSTRQEPAEDRALVPYEPHPTPSAAAPIAQDEFLLVTRPLMSVSFFFLLSGSICHFFVSRQVCQADFSRSFLTPPRSFLEEAEKKASHVASTTIAQCMAQEAASHHTMTRDTVKKSSKKTVAKQSKNKSKAMPAGQSSETTWWAALGQKSREDALKHFYASDQSKGLKMTDKCFASRMYKRLEHDVLLRSKAHKDAFAHCRSL